MVEDMINLTFLTITHISIFLSKYLHRENIFVPQIFFQSLVQKLINFSIFVILVKNVINDLLLNSRLLIKLIWTYDNTKIKHKQWTRF